MNGWNSYTDLINVLKCIDDIVWQAWEQIDHKPGLQVIHANELWVRDHFSCWPHKGGMEIKHNVHQKNDIYNAVDNQPCHIVLFGFKGDVVRDQNSSVEG